MLYFNFEDMADLKNLADQLDMFNTVCILNWYWEMWWMKDLADQHEFTVHVFVVFYREDNQQVVSIICNN